MDKFMDSPWFLRFTALFLAIILFFSVQAEEKKGSKAVGDTMDIIRDLPVQVYYDNENLVVTGVPETVNMTIEGPANIVQTTKLLKDFTLRVDLSSLPMGKHTVRDSNMRIFLISCKYGLIPRQLMSSSKRKSHKHSELILN